MKVKFFVLMVLLGISFVNAGNQTIQEAENCLNVSVKSMNEMIENNFSVERINGIIDEIKITLDGQMLLEEQGRKYDGETIIEKCEDIETIQNLAFDSRDSLSVLKGFYTKISEDVNLSSVDYSIGEIEQEIANERYEKVGELIDNVYDEIIDIKAKSTMLNVVYEVVSSNIKSFFVNNWKMLIIIILSLSSLLFIFYRTLRTIFLKLKLNRLELRKKSLKELLKQNQDDYFNKNNISDTIYHIKNKQLAELVRDINRQIPLIYEKMEKVKK